MKLGWILFSIVILILLIVLILVLIYKKKEKFLSTTDQTQNESDRSDRSDGDDWNDWSDDSSIYNGFVLIDSKTNRVRNDLIPSLPKSSKWSKRRYLESNRRKLPIGLQQNNL